MSLVETAIQEQLSLAYCQAVISQAGYGYAVPSIDHGIDVDVKYISIFGQKRIDAGTVLALQLKATKTAQKTSEFLKYPLSISAYERLKAPCAQPRILVVYNMPRDTNQWLHCSHEIFKMQHCAYWIKADDLPENPGNGSSLTVNIPLNNIFSSENVTLLAAPLVNELQNGA